MPEKKKTRKKKVNKKENKKEVKDSEKKEVVEKKEQVELKETDKKRIVKFILITSAVIIVLILSAYFYIGSLRNYSYEGVEFQTIQEGKLIFYQTSVPVLYQGSLVPYNFYLRTKPQELKEVPFENSNFELMKISVLSFEKEFDCDGDAVIAIANLMKLHEVAGINILRDENATCDVRYNFFQLKEGEKTEIKKVGENCYELIISDCKILEATERLMLEMFVKLKEE